MSAVAQGTERLSFEQVESSGLENILLEELMSLATGLSALACAAAIIAFPTARAETVCEGGGKKEVAAACSVRVQQAAYYIIDASAEATADKSLEGQSEGQLWMDVFVDDVKRGHAETQCGAGGPCRVTIVLQMLLKGGKVYKLEAKQGNNRADTRSTRIVTRTGEN